MGELKALLYGFATGRALLADQATSTQQDSSSFCGQHLSLSAAARPTARRSHEDQVAVGDRRRVAVRRSFGRACRPEHKLNLQGGLKEALAMWIGSAGWGCAPWLAPLPALRPPLCVRSSPAGATRSPAPPS